MACFNRSVLIYYLLVPLVFGIAAPENSDSRKHAVARAHLDMGLTRGIIEFTSQNKVVNVHLDITGLPENSGPFYYYINDGECNKNVGGIFNPYESTYGICDELSSNSECSIGDLSGKHGFINATCFETKYQDPYLSLNTHNKAFVGGHSVVVVDANHNKISCGNIKTVRKAKLTEYDYEYQLDNNYQEEGQEEEEEEEVKEKEVMNLKFINQEDEAESGIIYEVLSVAENKTFQNSSFNEQGNEFDSGSNALLASGIIGALAGGVAFLI